MGFEISIDELHNIANKLNIPLAYLFLDKIPQEECLIPDFKGKEHIPFSSSLKSCIASSLKKTRMV